MFCERLIPRQEAGVDPAPERIHKRTWKQFLRSHWETLCACDFFAVETLGVFGTIRVMVFFVIELRTRAVRIAGMRINPDSAWTMQIARNLLDPEDGFLRNATHLIHDRDPLTTAWSELLKSGGVKSVRIPASSPNCNPTLKGSCEPSEPSVSIASSSLVSATFDIFYASSLPTIWENGFIKVWVAY